MKRALIFDMDGTVVDNMAYHLRAWVDFFRKRGQFIDEKDFLLRTTGQHGREVMREYVRRDLSDIDADALIAEKETCYRALYAPHLKVVPGLHSLVELARANGVGLAIATSAPEANIRFTLDGLDLRRHFDVVVGSVDVKRGKPAPDVFLKAAEKCGAPPEHCVVFEDAPLGVQAADNAGMRAVALTTTMAAETFAGFRNVIAIAEDYTALSLESLFGVLPTTRSRD